MKLSHVVAKLTLGKRLVLGRLGGLALAGAALTAAAPSAAAQQFGVGVQIGGPRYVAPAPAYRAYGGGLYGPRTGYGEAPGYWQHRRFAEWRAQEAWQRQREFRERPLPYRRFGY